MEPTTMKNHAVLQNTTALPERALSRTAPRPAKVKVLVVDDSAIVRKVLSEILSAQPDIEVVGTAPDPYVARDKIISLRPDVLTLDIEMPRMDGLTFLDKLMQHYPLPVIVVSSLTQASTTAAMEALAKGAVDVLAKPGGAYSVGDLREDLPRRIRAAAWAGARLQDRRDPLRSPALPISPPQPVKDKPVTAVPACQANQIIGIGASTGGTQAIEAILTKLPAAMPPIVITQHIPAGFSLAFAQRLNQICALEVREAAGGETLACGTAYVAPGDHHLIVEGSGPGSWRLRLDSGAKVCYQRPSVDVMFHSLSVAAANRCWGILLTGMGSDGSQGMLKLKKTGARTIAESESSCIVFGMPREAIRLGAADRVLALNRIAPLLVDETRL